MVETAARGSESCSANSARSSAEFVQLAGQARAGERVDVGLLGEIEVGFEMGDQVEQAVPQAGDRVRETAGKLLQGRVQLGGFLRIDDAQDGLGPSEIDPAGQECPEGELAWFGRPRAEREAMREDQAHRAAEPVKWISATSCRCTIAGQATAPS